MAAGEAGCSVAASQSPPHHLCTPCIACPFSLLALHSTRCCADLVSHKGGCTYDMPRLVQLLHPVVASAPAASAGAGASTSAAVMAGPAGVDGGALTRPTDCLTDMVKHLLWQASTCAVVPPSSGGDLCELAASAQAQQRLFNAAVLLWLLFHVSVSDSSRALEHAMRRSLGSFVARPRRLDLERAARVAHIVRCLSLLAERLQAGKRAGSAATTCTMRFVVASQMVSLEPHRAISCFAPLYPWASLLSLLFTLRPRWPLCARLAASSGHDGRRRQCNSYVSLGKHGHTCGCGGQPSCPRPARAGGVGHPNAARWPHRTPLPHLRRGLRVLSARPVR